MFGIRFASANCKMLLLNWIVSKSTRVLDGKQVGEVDKFGYSGSCISPGDPTPDELCLRIPEIRLALTNLKHMCRRRDIRQLIKCRVCVAALVRAVLFYGSEILLLRVEDMRRFMVFGHG